MLFVSIRYDWKFSNWRNFLVYNKFYFEVGGKLTKLILNAILKYVWFFGCTYYTLSSNFLRNNKLNVKNQQLKIYYLYLYLSFN